MGRFLIESIGAIGAVVQFHEIRAGLNVADIVTAYEVTTSTGYRAVLPACLSDLCNGTVQPPRENCLRKIDSRGQHSGQSVDVWCKHVQTHCHDFHLPRARAFAQAVAATYGSAEKGRTSLAGLKR